MLDFIIIGASKCGSTSLASALSKSKDINFSLVKEPMTLYKYDDIDLIEKDYKRLFENKEGLKGEATTGYSEPMVLNKTIENLKKLEKTPKIIFIVRNPIRRIESSLMQLSKREKVNNYDEMLRTKLTLYTRCMYGLIVSKYIDAFGKENLLILNFDDFTIKKQKIVFDLKIFLDIEDINITYFEHKNKTVGSNRRPLLNRIWAKHISRKYNKYNLPSLEQIGLLSSKVFGYKIKKQDKFILNVAQRQTLKDILKNDSREFKELTGYDYWDLKH